jgi:hypothetical protein
MIAKSPSMSQEADVMAALCKGNSKIEMIDRLGLPMNSAGVKSLGKALGNDEGKTASMMGTMAIKQEGVLAAALAAAQQPNINGPVAELGNASVGQRTQASLGERMAKADLGTPNMHVPTLKRT